jgi:phosphatidylglycerophosphate synthase
MNCEGALKKRSEVSQKGDERAPTVQEEVSEELRGNLMVALVDVICSSTIIGGFVALAGAYALRVALQGIARYERIDQVGGSVLLSKRVMEMGYWGLQGVAKACVALGLTPNMITGMTLAAAALAAVAAAAGHFGVALVALLVGTLGDSLDGLVARMSGRMSRGGALFDAVADRYGEGVYLFGLGYYFREHAGLLALVFLAWMGSFMVSYVSAKDEALQVKAPRGLMRRTERAVYLTVATGITPLTQLLAGPERPAWVGEFPMIAALALIAVIANLSSVHRINALMRLLDAQEAVSKMPVPQPEAHDEDEDGPPDSLHEPRRHAA